MRPPLIGLVHAGEIEYQRVGNQQVERVGLPDAGRLPHAVAQSFAPAKLAFLAVHAVVALDFQQQVGITEAHPVAHSRAIHSGIRLPRKG
jgi:hypothetical protein